MDLFGCRLLTCSLNDYAVYNAQERLLCPAASALHYKPKKLIYEAKDFL